MTTSATRRDRQHLGVRRWTRSWELGVVLQYWSVLISNFRIARNGRGPLATTNNETLRLTSNEQRNTRALNEWRATGFCSGFFSAGMLFICQRTLFSGSELYFGKALVPCSTRNPHSGPQSVDFFVPARQDKDFLVAFLGTVFQKSVLRGRVLVSPRSPRLRVTFWLRRQPRWDLSDLMAPPVVSVSSV